MLYQHSNCRLFRLYLSEQSEFLESIDCSSVANCTYFDYAPSYMAVQRDHCHTVTNEDYCDSSTECLHCARCLGARAAQSRQSRAGCLLRRFRMSFIGDGGRSWTATSFCCRCWSIRAGFQNERLAQQGHGPRYCCHHERFHCVIKLNASAICCSFISLGSKVFSFLIKRY